MSRANFRKSIFPPHFIVRTDWTRDPGKRGAQQTESELLSKAENGRKDFSSYSTDKLAKL